MFLKNRDRSGKNERSRAATAWCALGLAFWMVFSPVSLCRAQDKPEEKKEGPTRVDVGVLINRIEQFSLKDSQFVANFYVWFRWKGDDIKPYETMEVVNGHIESKTESDAHDRDGEHYACYLVRATINQQFDLSRYPLERHHLLVELEDAAEDERIQYVADATNSGIGDAFAVSGFKPVGSKFEVIQHRYRTNYGDLTLPTGNESTYSRFVASVEVKRPNNHYAFKLFTSLYIATFIALLATFVWAEDLSSRLSLSVAAIFAAIGSQIIISSNLPESDQVTLADRVALTAIVFVFLALTESIVAVALTRVGKHNLACRIDRITFVVLTLTYIAINVVLTT